MRVLIVDTCYDAFLASHYSRSPGLADRPYDEQWRRLMDTFFGTADAYSHFLGELGHPAHEVVVNCKQLQSAWAREHDLDNPDGERVLLAQVEDFGPEVVYVQNLYALTDATMAALRRSGAFIAGQTATEVANVERLRLYDLLVTSFPHFVDHFRARGIDAEYFRIGFDPRVLDTLGQVPIEHDVVFVGALNSRSQHRRGNPMLVRAARHLPIRFWGYDLRGWAPWSPVRRRYEGEAWGIDMYRVLAASRVALNRHGEVARGYANNMRLFEATGVGSLLATDAKSNLAEFFEAGREVVTYSDVDDLVRQVRMYLTDEEARREVAAAGQARTLRDHTYEIRMRELVTILEKRL
jgi:glycosyltransferase involved in cell wall biosynthesis